MNKPIQAVEKGVVVDAVTSLWWRHGTWFRWQDAAKIDKGVEMVRRNLPTCTLHAHPDGLVRYYGPDDVLRWEGHDKALAARIFKAAARLGSG